MKLLTKYYRANITATIIVVLLSSVCYYFLIHYVLIEQLDNALKVEEQEVIDYVKENHSLPNPSSYKDQQVGFKPATGQHEIRRFSTVDIYNNEENEHVPTRQLLFPIQVNGKTYDAYILKSQEETEDLIQLILVITLGIVVLLLLIVFVVNRFLLRRLWKPFNSTLSQLKEINLSGKTKLVLEHSSTNEFNELNQVVTIMMKHLSQEYDALKNFTENASHEMQTPLAIINSKLDVLVQDENISEHQMGHLQAIYNALDRLSKLNQSLLLLTKIGNNQFTEIESIQLDIAIREKLLQFEEMTESKRLVIKTEAEPVNIRCNKQLLEILLSNLLSNAIRYNIKGGTILIKLSKNELVIANNSVLPALDGRKIFQRFYRHEDTKQDGNGLGLSIVKQICDSYGFNIEYHYQNERHLFKILF